MTVANKVEAPQNPLDVRGEEQLYQALRRFWHPVAYSPEVDPGPTGVVLLDERLVLVRLDGRVRAFPDLCVHCGTALSLGLVVEDELRCAYHGWTYGPDGNCTQIPSRFGSSIPRRARLRRYQSEERDGLVWVCLDDDPVFPIPSFPEHDDPSFRVCAVPAYDWNASATRRVENFVDFAHFAWVHDGVLGRRDRPEVPEHEVRREGPELRFSIVLTEPTDISKTEAYGIDASDPILEGERNYRLPMPFTVWLQARWPVDRCLVLFMVASPIGRKQCRSFTFIARNFSTDEDDQKFIEFQQEIAEADRVISESQRPEELPIDLSAELHIRGVDRVSLEYRKWLAELKELAPRGSVADRG
jgi:phenylpropionate dioxygenase-like ring-hydroxylating dioxygenase large terminal subunit